VRDVEDTGGVGRELLLYGRVFECGGHERWSFRGRIHEVMKKGGVCRGEAACSRLGAAGKIT
jgi:hypothetical protein